MPIVNGYVTAAEYKDWAKITDSVDDLLIDRAVTAASRGIDNYCVRRFWQDVGGVRRYDACDRWDVEIDDLVSVTTLKTDDNGDGTFETTWSASDYQLLPVNPAAAPELEPFTQIHAVASRTFPLRTTNNARVGLIEITGTWGWPAIPEAVKQACLLVVNRIVKRKESPEGVSGFDEFGVIRISSRDDPDAVRFLDPYWNPAAVGV